MKKPSITTTARVAESQKPSTTSMKAKIWSLIKIQKKAILSSFQTPLAKAYKKIKTRKTSLTLASWQPYFQTRRWNLSTYEIEKSLEFVWSIQEIREELKYIVFRILSYEICNWKDNFKEKFFWINTNDFFNIIKTHWLSKNEFDILFNVLYSDYWKIIQKMYQKYHNWMKKEDFLNCMWKYF